MNELKEPHDRIVHLCVWLCIWMCIKKGRDKESFLSCKDEAMDIVRNLSPIGIEVSTLEAYPPQIQHTHEWPNQTAYSKFLKKERGLEEGVSIQEKMSFYLSALGSVTSLQ